MSRYLMALVLFSLYAAVASWVVTSQGERYRTARRSELAQAITPSPEAKPEIKTAVASAEPARPPATSPPPREPAPVTKPVTPEPSSSVAVNLPVPAPAPTPPAQSKSAAASSPSPSSKPSGEQTDSTTDPVWASPAVNEIRDLATLSTNDEAQLGRDMHALILSLHPELRSGPLPRKVEETAEPLLTNTRRKDVRYTFTVLDSSAVNVFSHPGGYIYVTRGFFDLFGNDEEYVLEFALAHEIAHVDLKHASACLQDPGVKAMKTGTIKQLYSLILPLGYLDEQELEADRWAAQQMDRLGRTKRTKLAYLRKLDQYARTHGFENGRGLIKELPKDSSAIDNHIRAHPAPWKRIKALEAQSGGGAAPSR